MKYQRQVFTAEDKQAFKGAAGGPRVALGHEGGGEGSQ
jgi:hypothetical protein